MFDSRASGNHFFEELNKRGFASVYSLTQYDLQNIKSTLLLFDSIGSAAMMMFPKILDPSLFECNSHV